MNAKRKGCARLTVTALAVMAGLCVLLAAVSAIANRSLPERSEVVDRLSPLDKTRLAETIHLRQTLGDSVLPGWATADIPLIAYNEEYIFLTGMEDPSVGWRTVLRGQQFGGPWVEMQGDDFLGQTYFTQPIPASGQTTQAFTVRVGNTWAASLPTYDWANISLSDPMREDTPAFLRSFVPYRLFIDQLLTGSDAYASMMLHEAAHAYQGIRAPERLAASERASSEHEAAYPWESAAFQTDWQTELDILHDALSTDSDADREQLARSFLDQRAKRRSAAGLPTGLIDYERAREWEEGIAKYAERMIYLQAADPSLYAPLPETAGDPEFKGYRNGQKKWDQEVDQIRRMADDLGDGRFYYSGFAQAALLDRLAPGWKERLFEEGVYLEDLLSEALR